MITEKDIKELRELYQSTDISDKYLLSINLLLFFHSLGIINKAELYSRIKDIIANAENTNEDE